MNPNNSSPYAFFGFPSKNDYNSLFSYKEFYSSGTYEIPVQHIFLTIMLVSGGGGGGSGAVQASNVVASGGAGGAPGSIIIKTFFIKDLIKYGNILDIEIGSGGSGGNGVSTVNSNGNDGIQGSSSRIKFSGSPVYFMNAKTFPPNTPTGRGKGGTTSGWTSPEANSMEFNGIYEGKSYNRITDRAETFLLNLSSSYTGNFHVRPCSGFGAGGKNSVPTYFTGINMNNEGLGNSIDTGSWRYVYWGFSGVSNPGSSVSLTVANLPKRVLFFPNWFTYGFTGAASATTPGSGSAGNLGTGGSGGGATINGSTSGAGGKGGDGYCLIVSRG